MAEGQGMGSVRGRHFGHRPFWELTGPLATWPWSTNNRPLEEGGVCQEKNISRPYIIYITTAQQYLRFSLGLFCESFRQSQKNLAIVTDLAILGSFPKYGPKAAYNWPTVAVSGEKQPNTVKRKWNQQGSKRPHRP